MLRRLITLDPAIIRGLVVSVVAIVVAVFQVTVTEGLTENIISFVLSLFGLLAAVLIRPSVTPNAKVLAFKPDPELMPSTIEAGEAVSRPDEEGRVVSAASSVPVKGRRAA